MHTDVFYQLMVPTAFPHNKNKDKLIDKDLMGENIWNRANTSNITIESRC